jgi:hypothetical protein
MGLSVPKRFPLTAGILGATVAPITHHLLALLKDAQRIALALLRNRDGEDGLAHGRPSGLVVNGLQAVQPVLEVGQRVGCLPGKLHHFGSQLADLLLLAGLTLLGVLKQAPLPEKELHLTLLGLKLLHLLVQIVVSHLPSSLVVNGLGLGFALSDVVASRDPRQLDAMSLGTSGGTLTTLDPVTTVLLCPYLSPCMLATHALARRCS